MASTPPKPFEAISPGPKISAETESWAAAISSARCASRVGVARFEGMFCSSRVRFWASVATRAVSTWAAASVAPSSTSDSGPPSASRPVFREPVSKVARMKPSVRADARAAGSPLSGTTQATEPAPSSFASLAEMAPATRARSSLISSRGPSPTESTRFGAPGWSSAVFLNPALTSSAPGALAASSGRSSPSKTPTTTRSASASRGSCPLTVARIRAECMEVGARPTLGIFHLRRPSRVGPHPSIDHEEREPQMPSTVILGTARTPFGKMGGGLASLDATDLGGKVIECALERASVDPDQVQQVVFGQVLQAGQGQIPSRQAQIKGGIPKEVPSETINKVCASGMRALGLADQAIRAGDTDVAVTGGMESMSQAPYLLPGARFGFRMGDVQAIDSMTHDGLTNPFTQKQMINEASEVGNELEITRVDMDRFAERSHRLAAEATDAGRLAEEIVGVTVKSRKGENTIEADEAIRADTTIEVLAKLKAIGDDDATHTAGNAPGVNDGAGAIVVASEEWAEKEGRTLLARVLSYGTVADDFPYLAKTPANAARQALEKIGKSPEDVDLWEINEAFASAALNSMRMLGVDDENVNVNGGAIALGHPIGASGSRIVGSLVHELCPRGGAARGSG